MTIEQHKNIVQKMIDGLERDVIINDLEGAVKWLDCLERFLSMDTLFANENVIDKPK